MNYNIPLRGFAGYAIDRLVEREYFSKYRGATIHAIAGAAMVDLAKQMSDVLPVESNLEKMIEAYGHEIFRETGAKALRRVVMNWIDGHLGALRTMGISPDDPAFRNSMRKDPLKAV